MKSDFLRELGITDQNVINAIMAENGKDVNAVKGNMAELETKVNELTSQITERDTQLTTLKESVKDNEKLTAKITELENANTESKTTYENKIAEIQKSHAIESGVRDAKAKNVKAVMALLDMEKISYKDGKLDGLSSQIESLTKGEDTSFLFGTVNVPAGTNLNNPPSNGGNPPTSKSLAEAIAKAIK